MPSAKGFKTIPAGFAGILGATVLAELAFGEAGLAGAALFAAAVAAVVVEVEVEEAAVGETADVTAFVEEEGVAGAADCAGVEEAGATEVGATGALVFATAASVAAGKVFVVDELSASAVAEKISNKTAKRSALIIHYLNRLVPTLPM